MSILPNATAAFASKRVGKRRCDMSLFYLFIGQMLRERYALPQQVPQDMRRLLTQLDKPRTMVQTSQLRQRTERAVKDNSKAP
jgi:hypothetical protein